MARNHGAQAGTLRELALDQKPIAMPWRRRVYFHLSRFFLSRKDAPVWVPGGQKGSFLLAQGHPVRCKLRGGRWALTVGREKGRDVRGPCAVAPDGPALAGSSHGAPESWSTTPPVHGGSWGGRAIFGTPSSV